MSPVWHLCWPFKFKLQSQWGELCYVLALALSLQQHPGTTVDLILERSDEHMAAVMGTTHGRRLQKMLIFTELKVNMKSTSAE